MYKYCNGTIKYYGANSLPLSTNLGGQEELVDYSFLCQTGSEWLALLRALFAGEKRFQQPRGGS